MQFNILSTLALIILSYERHTKTTYRTVLLPFLHNQMISYLLLDRMLCRRAYRKDRKTHANCAIIPFLGRNREVLWLHYSLTSNKKQ